MEVRFVLIGTTMRGKKVIGIKALDRYTLNSKDYGLSEAIDNIDSIEGIKFEEGEFVGTNGNLENYSINKNKVTILFRLVGGFLISNTSGEVSEVNDEGIIKLAEKYGITNGELVKSTKNHIKPINNKFERLEGKINDGKWRGISEDYYESNRVKDEEQVKINQRGEMRGRCKKGTEKEGKRANGGGHSTNKILDGLDEFESKLEELGYINKIYGSRFYKYMKDAKENDEYNSLERLCGIREYSDMNCIILDNGLAGIAVNDKKEIVSVFKHKECKIKCVMKYLIASAIMNGGDRLVCYSINAIMPSIYVRYGFIPVCRVKFNRDLALYNWNYELYGEPDRILMVYGGDTLSKVIKEDYKYKLFSDYKPKEIPYIEDSKHKCAYSNAVAYRDKYIDSMNGGLVQNIIGARLLRKLNIRSIH